MTGTDDGLGAVIVRHGGTIQDHGGIFVETLLDDINAGRASVGFAVYEVGSSTGPTGVTKPGMEFLMLLEGSLIAEVDAKDYPMSPGDSIWFATTIPHRGWNPGDVTARALYVNYVPTADSV